MKDLKHKIKSMNYETQIKFRVVLWFILILFIVGLGLVWIFYGTNAAISGFLCLLGAGIPVSLIAIFLIGLDAFVKKSD